MSSGNESLHSLVLPRGTLQLPVFLPDGTQGVVRGVDAQDLEQAHIQAVQMNGYHLMQRPGSSTIQALGGLHRMTGWRGPIFTDSGGFQIYSLLRQFGGSGAITDRGATFRPHGTDRKYNLTPEKSVQLQISYGSDAVISLDDCTHVDDSLAVQENSVRRTIDWAARGKREFNRLIAAKGLSAAETPILIAVVQGGNESALRVRCAEELLAIGFDGFGYGGWPLDSEGNLLTEMLQLTREMIPPDYTLHALGVGHPANVVACAQMGYNIFDSTMPTRDARHGRLYAFQDNPHQLTLDSSGDWFHYIYIKDKKHIKTNQPLSPGCDCPVCAHYSLGYLHHLFKLNDALYTRLATLHNLRFMTLLMQQLRRGQPA